MPTRKAATRTSGRNAKKTKTTKTSTSNKNVDTSMNSDGEQVPYDKESDRDDDSDGNENIFSDGSDSDGERRDAAKAKRGREKKTPAKQKSKKTAKTTTVLTPCNMQKAPRPVPLSHRVARVSTGGDDFVPAAAADDISEDGTNEATASSLAADNASLRLQLEQIQRYMGTSGGKGKTVTRRLRNEGLGTSDLLNIQELYAFITEKIWRVFKMMPKGWNKWRTEPLTTCAQMMAKVTVPYGMTPEMYWNNVIVLFANEKLCATRANFKMNLLKKYKGKCVVDCVLHLNQTAITDTTCVILCHKADWESDRLLQREDTKLFVGLRDMDVDDTASKTFEDYEDLMRFLDGYAVHNVGTRELHKYLKAKPGNTLLDCLSVYDIAYTILVYENTADVWEEIMRCRGVTNPRTAEQLYHAKRGTKLREFSDGWTQEGHKYYRKLVEMVNGWKSDGMFWETLQEHWREYVRLHHASINVRNGPTMDADDDIEEDEEAVEMMDFTQM